MSAIEEVNVIQRHSISDDRKQLEGDTSRHGLPEALSAPITADVIRQVNEGNHDLEGAWVIAQLDAAFAGDALSYLPQERKLDDEMMDILRERARYSYSGTVQLACMMVGRQAEEAYKKTKEHSPALDHVVMQIDNKYPDMLQVREDELKDLLSQRMTLGLGIAFEPHMMSYFALCAHHLALAMPGYTFAQLVHTMKASRSILQELASMDSAYMKSISTSQVNRYMAERQEDGSGTLLGLKIQLESEMREESAQRYLTQRATRSPDELRRLPSLEPAGCWANSGVAPLVTEMISRVLAGLDAVAAA